MPDQRSRTRLSIAGNPLSVRDGLHRLFGTSLMISLSEQDRGTVEIVLAEVFNNIVEHAYASHSGDIEVEVEANGQALTFHVSDTGLPMPDVTPPKGRLFIADRFEDLPEGGFGWFLIRSLSHDLVYCRVGDRNLLSFTLLNGQCAN